MSSLHVNNKLVNDSEVSIQGCRRQPLPVLSRNRKRPRNYQMVGKTQTNPTPLHSIDYRSGIT